MTKRNLGFIKRDPNQDWTQYERDIITNYCGDIMCDVEPSKGIIFDDGEIYAFMCDWLGQKQSPNFKNCKIHVFEDFFDIN